MTITPTDTPPEAAALDLDKLEALAKSAEALGYMPGFLVEALNRPGTLLALVRAARQHAEPQGEPEPVARRGISQFDQLFDRLPSFDPRWPDDLRAKWLGWAEAFALAARSAKPGATSPSAGSGEGGAG